MSDPTAKDGANTEEAVYLKHQAIAILDAQQSEAQRKIRKRHRKDAELAGVPLQDMDWVIKTIEMPVSEIRKFFTSKLRLLSFNGINVGEKVAELIADHTEDRTYEGQLAGMQGKACAPPANLTPNERDTWIKGWHGGNRARDAAQFDLADEEKRRQEEADRVPKVDPSTDAAQNLGGEGYGEEGGAPAEEGDKAAAPPSGTPHQPKKPRGKKAAAPETAH
jgi:hypothetical protein